MSDKRMEQRTEQRRRSQHDDGDQRDDYPSRRRDQYEPVKGTEYIFHRHGARPPARVHDSYFRLGDIVSTSEGPHKVVEVYWEGSDTRGWKAYVLLRPVEEKEAPKEAKKAAKGAKKRPASRSDAKSQNRSRDNWSQDNKKRLRYTKAYGG